MISEYGLDSERFVAEQSISPARAGPPAAARLLATITRKVSLFI
jgi:hypothetical protein